MTLRRTSHHSQPSGQAWQAQRPLVTVAPQPPLILRIGEAGESGFSDRDGQTGFIHAQPETCWGFTLKKVLQVQE